MNWSPFTPWWECMWGFQTRGASRILPKWKLLLLRRWVTKKKYWSASAKFWSNLIRVWYRKISISFCIAWTSKISEQERNQKNFKNIYFWTESLLTDISKKINPKSAEKVKKEFCSLLFKNKEIRILKLGGSQDVLDSPKLVQECLHIILKVLEDSKKE